MKKILLSLLIMFSVFCLTGCGKELIEEEQRTDIISVIEEKKLIDESWKYIDMVRQMDNVMYLDNDVTGYDYVYQDLLGKYHAVELDTIKFNEDTSYVNVEVKANIEYYFINIFECDYIVTTKEIKNGGKITTKKVNHNYDNGYDTYLLHYEGENAILEQVFYEK